jgi:hypothetical protein
MMTIEPHLSTAELEARYKTASEPIAKSHFHALWLLSSGCDRAEVAEILSFSTRWVIELIKRYNEGDPERLGDQRAKNGTKPTIDPHARGAGRAQRADQDATRRRGLVERAEDRALACRFPRA